MFEIRIESRNLTIPPQWKADIEARVETLTRGHADLLHARITLTKTRLLTKKLPNAAEALVVLTFPHRRTITARKQDKTFEGAIRAAFAAVEIEVQKFRDKRSSHEVGTGHIRV
jgi:ribosome-associated translation inhibitor RaiA